MAKKSALGKGLGALLGNGFDDFRPQVSYISDTPSPKEETAAEDTPSDGADAGHPAGKEDLSSVCELPLGQIEPNPFQPRKTFDDEALRELSESIRAIGLIQPITVRRISAQKFQIISGERRFRACRAAGLATIPAYIISTDDRGMLEMAIVENLQREDLDPIEIALSFRRLIDECSLTQEQMAERVGKKRASVTNYLRLLKLAAPAQHLLKTGKISVGHAKVLLAVEDEELQERLCNDIVSGDLSVRQLELRVKKLLSTPDKPQKELTDLPEPHIRILERVGKYFDNRISFKRTDSGKGTMTIHFDSDSEVERFLKALEDNNI